MSKVRRKSELYYELGSINVDTASIFRYYDLSREKGLNYGYMETVQDHYVITPAWKVTKDNEAN